ncbi:MAG: Bug family tripartite tricarboxylate transporter substrate binding protein [Candidatus Binatia bacterium]
MSKKLSYLLVGLVFALGASTPALGEEFYKGKTLQFVVGFSPGGGYDTYTRYIARHIGKYIPGNPTPIVQNRTGAGSLIAAHYMYRKAKPDGLTVGVWTPGLILAHALGDKKVRFKPRKLGWIGTPTPDSVVCAIMGFTGLKTLDDIVKSKRTLKMPATRAPGNTTDPPLILNRALGTKFKVITGYRGTATMRLAMQTKEVDGACWTWESMRITARSMLDAKGDNKLIPFVIQRRWNDPEVKNIPLFRDVIKDKDTLAMYNAWNAQNDMTRPYSVPPGTPKERLNILRKAFEATLKDPKLLAEAKKSKLNVSPVTWQRIEKALDKMYSISPQIKEDLQLLTGLKKKKS